MRDPRTITEAEREKCYSINRLFSELTTYRNVFGGQWEEASRLILPTSLNTFFYGSYNFPGAKKTQQQIDSTGARALNQFCAICDSMITPKNQFWHGFTADEYVMKDRATRKYFNQLRDILFRFRYRPIANFHGNNYSNWSGLGAFGNAVMYVDELDTRIHPGHGPGLRYKSIPIGEAFFAENHQGIVTTLCRWFRLTPEQSVQKFGEDWLPDKFETALEMSSQTPINFLHCVMPRLATEYDPERLDAKGKPFYSQYICLDSMQFMQPEGGYRTFPYAVSRYETTPGEVYGRGPAQMTLPALKTLNAAKATYLKTAHRAGDPVYLLPEDGLIDFDQTPGAKNPGGVSPDGKPLVHVMPAGEVQITREMMGDEAGIIDDMFMTSLFKVLMANPQMTATQVIELMNERGMLVSPTLGRQHNEYVGGLAERELDVLTRLRVRGQPVLPPMPPRLREAMGYFEIDDTSPLAMQAKMSKAAGFMRMVETSKEIVNITQNPEHLDYYNFSAAIPAIAQIQNVQEDWMNDERTIAKMRQNRAKMMAAQQQQENLPRQAAMLNAQAKIAKAQPGLGQGGIGGPAVPAAPPAGAPPGAPGGVPPP